MIALAIAYASISLIFLVIAPGDLLHNPHSFVGDSPWMLALCIVIIVVFGPALAFFAVVGHTARFVWRLCVRG